MVGLQPYTADGRLQIDNNGAERQLRAVAVGRKKWLFAGSMAGGHCAALIQACRLAGIEPFRYLKDVLIRVPPPEPDCRAHLSHLGQGLRPRCPGFRRLTPYSITRPGRQTPLL